MRFLFSLILTLFAITAQSQVMKLTSAGKSISISIDDIVFVRAGTPSGSVITYGQTQARLNVSQTMSAIQSASCSNLVSLSVVENISGQPQSTTLLFNVRMIAEVIPDVNNKAVMTIRTSPRVKYTTVSSYTSVTNTISACITGGGGGGSVVTDATLSGDGSSGDPLSVNPIGTSLIENNAVTNGKLATMPALTIKGNNTGATGAALDLTKVQVQSMLSVDDLITLTGVAEGNTNLLTFTGTIIPNNSTIKAALQALETAVEIIGDTITVSDSPKIDLTMLNRNITATLVPGGVALTDIAASGASNGQIIKFDGTNWVVGSDVTGSSIDSSFQKLAGIVAGGYANKRYTDNKWSRGKVLIGFNPTDYGSLDTLGQIVIAPPATGTTTAILFKQAGAANSILKADGSNPFELDGPYTIVKSTGTSPVLLKMQTAAAGTYNMDYNSALFRINNEGASRAMLAIHTSAANNALFVDANTNLNVGGNSISVAKIGAFTSSGATASMLGMVNSTGTSRFFRSNATPEGAITGIVGDWTFSTTGLFAKITGAGNTGWGEYMNLKKNHGATNGQLLKWNTVASAWIPANDDGNTYTGGIGISVIGTVINNDGVTSINGEIGDVVDYVKLTDPIGTTGGDVSGTIDEMIVIGLQGTPVDGTAPTLGQVLAFDGTNWIPTTTGSGGGGITNFTGAQGAAPGVAASSHDGETFRNDVYGELWGSNGSVWYPFSYGGKECQDTVLVSAITVQPGGSVTTGSPLVRSSLGVWEHLYNYATPNTIPDGVVTDVVSGPRAIIQYCGVRKGSGATPNSSYYVDQSANTGFTTTKPASNIRPLGKIASNGDFLVNAGLLFSKDNFPGIIKNGSLSGSGIVGDTLRISTGDKGDVDVTNNGLTWTVDTGAVTTIKILDAAVTMAKINQSAATTGQVIKWNGSAWAPGTDGGFVSEPLNQLVYGTGTGIDSSPTLEKNGDTLAINPGNILIRPTNNFSNYYTLNIWPKKNNGTTANMGILRIPMDSISNRANTDPYHGNFPAWLKKISWDNSINVPAGGPLDTTGNLLVNEGFNFDQSDPTYNPKFPQFYWSTEMKYRAGTNTKSWIESHWEFRDTLGRIARPVSTAYSYDGSYADVSFQSDYKTFSKGRDQAALTPGESNWELANFETGQSDINYNLSQNIKKKYTGNLIQKYKNKTPGNAYMNILRHEANDVVQIGDSAGVRIYNDLYFALNGSNPAKIKAQQTVLRFDSMLVEFVSQPGVLRNHRYLAPGIAASAGLLFDGNKLSWGKYAVAESIFGVNINAPNDALLITSAGKLVYNSTAAFADFDLNQRTNAFGGGLRLLNTGGIYTTLRANSSGHLTITGNSVALSDKVIATTNDITAIEGIVTAPQGSIAMSGGATANGALFGKYSGTGPTGWGKYLNLIDPNTATSGQVLIWNGTNWAPATDVSLANTDQTLTANRAIALGANSLTVSSSVVADQSITATFNNDGIVMSALDESGVDAITGEIFLSGAFASIGVDNGVSATSYTNYQDASSTWKWNDITITLNAANGISIANAETNDGMKYTANNENAILLTDRNVPDMNTVRRNNRERFSDVTSTTSPVDLTSTNKDNLINQGGTQTTFTFNLPATPGDGQICELTFSNIVTTLTIGAQGGITILGTAPTTAAVGTRLEYKYYATITSWIRVQ